MLGSPRQVRRYSSSRAVRLATNNKNILVFIRRNPKLSRSVHHDHPQLPWMRFRPPPHAVAASRVEGGLLILAGVKNNAAPTPVSVTSNSSTLNLLRGTPDGGERLLAELRADLNDIGAAVLRSITGVPLRKHTENIRKYNEFVEKQAKLEDEREHAIGKKLQVNLEKPKFFKFGCSPLSQHPTGTGTSGGGVEAGGGGPLQARFLDYELDKREFVSSAFRTTTAAAERMFSVQVLIDRDDAKIPVSAWGVGVEKGMVTLGGLRSFGPFSNVKVRMTPTITKEIAASRLGTPKTSPPNGSSGAERTNLIDTEAVRDSLLQGINTAVVFYGDFKKRGAEQVARSCFLSSAGHVTLQAFEVLEEDVLRDLLDGRGFSQDYKTFELVQYGGGGLPVHVRDVTRVQARNKSDFSNLLDFAVFKQGLYGSHIPGAFEPESTAFFARPVARVYLVDHWDLPGKLMAQLAVVELAPLHLNDAIKSELQQQILDFFIKEKIQTSVARTDKADRAERLAQPILSTASGGSASRGRSASNANDPDSGGGRAGGSSKLSVFLDQMLGDTKRRFATHCVLGVVLGTAACATTTSASAAATSSTGASAHTSSSHPAPGTSASCFACLKLFEVLQFGQMVLLMNDRYFAMDRSLQNCSRANADARREVVESLKGELRKAGLDVTDEILLQHHVERSSRLALKKSSSTHRTTGASGGRGRPHAPAAHPHPPAPHSISASDMQAEDPRLSLLRALHDECLHQSSEDALGQLYAMNQSHSFIRKHRGSSGPSSAGFSGSPSSTTATTTAATPLCAGSLWKANSADYSEEVRLFGCPPSVSPNAPCLVNVPLFDRALSGAVRFEIACGTSVQLKVVRTTTTTTTGGGNTLASSATPASAQNVHAILLPDVLDFGVESMGSVAGFFEPPGPKHDAVVRRYLPLREKLRSVFDRRYRLLMERWADGSGAHFSDPALREQFGMLAPAQLRGRGSTSASGSRGSLTKSLSGGSGGLATGRGGYLGPPSSRSGIKSPTSSTPGKKLSASAGSSGASKRNKLATKPVDIHVAVEHSASTGAIRLTNLGHSMEVLVNGKICVESCVLRPADRVQLGPYLFELQMASSFVSAFDYGRGLYASTPGGARRGRPDEDEELARTSCACSPDPHQNQVDDGANFSVLQAVFARQHENVGRLMPDAATLSWDQGGTFADWLTCSNDADLEVTLAPVVTFAADAGFDGENRMANDGGLDVLPGAPRFLAFVHHRTEAKCYYPHDFLHDRRTMLNRLENLEDVASELSKRAKVFAEKDGQIWVTNPSNTSKITELAAEKKARAELEALTVHGNEMLEHLAEREGDLARRAAEVAERERRVEEAEAALGGNDSSLAAREAEIVARWDEVLQMQQELSRRLQEAETFHDQEMPISMVADAAGARSGAVAGHGSSVHPSTAAQTRKNPPPPAPPAGAPAYPPVGTGTGGDAAQMRRNDTSTSVASAGMPKKEHAQAIAEFSDSLSKATTFSRQQKAKARAESSSAHRTPSKMDSILAGGASSGGGKTPRIRVLNNNPFNKAAGNAIGRSETEVDAVVHPPRDETSAPAGETGVASARSSGGRFPAPPAKSPDDSVVEDAAGSMGSLEIVVNDASSAAPDGQAGTAKFTLNDPYRKNFAASPRGGAPGSSALTSAATPRVLNAVVASANEQTNDLAEQDQLPRPPPVADVVVTTRSYSAVTPSGGPASGWSSSRSQLGGPPPGGAAGSIAPSGSPGATRYLKPAVVPQLKTLALQPAKIPASLQPPTGVDWQGWMAQQMKNSMQSARLSPKGKIENPSALLSSTPQTVATPQTNVFLQKSAAAAAVAEKLAPQFLGTHLKSALGAENTLMQRNARLLQVPPPMVGQQGIGSTSVANSASDSELLVSDADTDRAERPAGLWGVLLSYFTWIWIGHVTLGLEADDVAFFSRIYNQLHEPSAGAVKVTTTQWLKRVLGELDSYSIDSSVFALAQGKYKPRKKYIEGLVNWASGLGSAAASLGRTALKVTAEAPLVLAGMEQGPQATLKDFGYQLAASWHGKHMPDATKPELFFKAYSENATVEQIVFGGPGGGFQGNTTRMDMETGENEPQKTLEESVHDETEAKKLDYYRAWADSLRAYRSGKSIAALVQGRNKNKSASASIRHLFIGLEKAARYTGHLQQLSLQFEKSPLGKVPGLHAAVKRWLFGRELSKSEQETSAKEKLAKEQRTRAKIMQMDSDIDRRMEEHQRRDSVPAAGRSTETVGDAGAKQEEIELAKMIVMHPQWYFYADSRTRKATFAFRGTMGGFLDDWMVNISVEGDHSSPVHTHYTQSPKWNAQRGSGGTKSNQSQTETSSTAKRVDKEEKDDACQEGNKQHSASKWRKMKMWCQRKNRPRVGGTPSRTTGRVSSYVKLHNGFYKRAAVSLADFELQLRKACKCGALTNVDWLAGLQDRFVSSSPDHDEPETRLSRPYFFGPAPLPRRASVEDGGPRLDLFEALSERLDPYEEFYDDAVREEVIFQKNRKIEPPAFVHYLQNCVGRDFDEVVLTGHSLGGATAMAQRYLITGKIPWSVWRGVKRRREYDFTEQHKMRRTVNIWLNNDLVPRFAHLAIMQQPLLVQPVEKLLWLREETFRVAKNKNERDKQEEEPADAGGNKREDEQARLDNRDRKQELLQQVEVQAGGSALVTNGTEKDTARHLGDGQALRDKLEFEAGEQHELQVYRTVLPVSAKAYYLYLSHFDTTLGLGKDLGSTVKAHLPHALTPFLEHLFGRARRGDPMSPDQGLAGAPSDHVGEFSTNIDGSDAVLAKLWDQMHEGAGAGAKAATRIFWSRALGELGKYSVDSGIFALAQGKYKTSQYYSSKTLNWVSGMAGAAATLGRAVVGSKVTAKQAPLVAAGKVLDESPEALKTFADHIIATWNGHLPDERYPELFFTPFKKEVSVNEILYSRETTKADYWRAWQDSRRAYGDAAGIAAALEKAGALHVFIGPERRPKHTGENQLLAHLEKSGLSAKIPGLETALGKWLFGGKSSTMMHPQWHFKVDPHTRVASLVFRGTMNGFLDDWMTNISVEGDSTSPVYQYYTQSKKWNEKGMAHESYDEATDKTSPDSTVKLHYGFYRRAAISLAHFELQLREACDCGALAAEYTEGLQSPRTHEQQGDEVEVFFDDDVEEELVVFDATRKLEPPAFLNYLQNEIGKDFDKLAIAGHSLGGATAMVVHRLRANSALMKALLLVKSEATSASYAVESSGDAYGVNEALLGGEPESATRERTTAEQQSCCFLDVQTDRRHTTGGPDDGLDDMDEHPEKYKSVQTITFSAPPVYSTTMVRLLPAQRYLITGKIPDWKSLFAPVTGHVAEFDNIEKTKMRGTTNIWYNNDLVPRMAALIVQSQPMLVQPIETLLLLREEELEVEDDKKAVAAVVMHKKGKKNKAGAKKKTKKKVKRKLYRTVLPVSAKAYYLYLSHLDTTLGLWGDLASAEDFSSASPRD
eukprot:g9773.t1